MSENQASETIEPANIEAAIEGEKLIISVKGHFTYGLHRPFRDSYIHCDHEVASFILDFNEVEYLDSSAMGMILLLKKFVDDRKGAILSIINCSHGNYGLFKIANFDKMFSIEEKSE